MTQGELIGEAEARGFSSGASGLSAQPCGLRHFPLCTRSAFLTVNVTAMAPQVKWVHPMEGAWCLGGRREAAIASGSWHRLTFGPHEVSTVVHVLSPEKDCAA